MQAEKIKIVYLDDEISNLNAFKADFRRDFEIYTALNSEKAFELIQEHKPEIIFSDQRMPEMTGVEFFNAVRQVYPEAVRILITAYTDVSDVIDAINKGNIYRFIGKPWNEGEIRQSILNGHEMLKTRRNLEEKVLELQRTNEELNRFIYSASHDLRAPLMSVLGLVKVAELEEGIDPKSMTFFSMIESSINRLDIFIQNIIEYYQNSRSISDIRVIHFNTLIQDILENLRYYANSSSIHFEVDISGEEEFINDEFRVRIILSNLISNAIKYQKDKEGNKKIGIKVIQTKEKAEIQISDNGVGILEEHLKNIFKMFFRADVEKSGSGIGLYIVKEALEKLNGTIDVNSKRNLGTSFQISIPSKR